MSGEYTLKKFEGNRKTNWPLPPSSVFRCKAATPWLDPLLFYVDQTQTFTPLIREGGVLVVGDVVPEVADQEMNEIYPEYEYPSSNLVKLQYRRSVEYSDNPERGIDLGSEGANNTRSILVRPKMPRSVPLEQTNKTRRKDSLQSGTGTDTSSNSGKHINRSNSQHRKKRLWSPFQKDREQQWKLFY